MKHLKTFESITGEDKNKIFLIDTCSFIPTLLEKIKEVDFYLADKFTAILCSHEVENVYWDITLDELVDKLNYVRGGSGNMQVGIDYIIKNKLEGRVLLFTDGVIDISISYLEYYISILIYDEYSYAMKPNINPKRKIGKECLIFYEDLESLEFYYPPRDITPEKYELKKAAQTYNL